MSEGSFLASALEQYFTSSDHGWFSPFMAATDGLTAAQGAAVPAEKFNSVWAVVNHVRYWQEVTLCQLQNTLVDPTALGSPGGSGWPAIADPTDEAAWEAARARVLEVNQALAKCVAGLSDAELDEVPTVTGDSNTRRNLVMNMIAHNSYHTCEIISIRHLQGLFFGAA